ncbi:hypothetical protein H0H92_006879 [Tricholoma furcatifolium]|nr:hypothetical protein H0H92_006879 [Tricholoma furcatifolium]
MSESKRKKSLEQIHDEIKEILLTVKPKLDDLKSTTRPSLTSDLYQIASLAEAFSEQRPRSNSKSWLHLADSLDQEGVNLWNISGLIRRTPEDDGRLLVAAIRLAAFRLIEGGVEAKPGIESLLHMLQLASKTGATLSEAGRHDVAARVLTSAAKVGYVAITNTIIFANPLKYEEVLRNTDDQDGVHQTAIACGTVVYFSSRMEAAWQEQNITVADFMSQKITGESVLVLKAISDSIHHMFSEDDQRLALLPLHSRQLLASKFHRIGKSILEQRFEGVKPSDAVLWLQKAFALGDPLDEMAAPGVAELKISILQALGSSLPHAGPSGDLTDFASIARAFFIAESYDRAEATLEELLPSIDASPDHASSGYRELRWLRLATLKRRKAGDAALLDAFKSIIDHMECSEANITE